MREWLPLGGGLAIDPLTLRTVVVDHVLFAETTGASADPGDRLFVALVTGRLEEAQRLADVYAADASSPLRLRALTADLLSRRGQHSASVARYEELLAEVRGSTREPVVRQHLGKALFEAGQLTAAQDQFVQALQLREVAGAPADQVASSRLALARVTELLGEQGPAVRGPADPAVPLLAPVDDER